MIQIIGLKHVPIIKENDDLVEIMLNSLNRMELNVQDSDIFVIAQSIISRKEGRVRDLKKKKPTSDAIQLAKEIKKDPHLVTLILEESKKVLRTAVIEGNGKIIVETKLGYICADAGIDFSNSPDDLVTLLPVDPDRSAAEVRSQIRKKTGKDVAIIISDTHGRPFRRGSINVALGVAGIKEILDYRGQIDLFGYQLQKTKIAIADELASAAELIMGEAGEGMPIILIRGYYYENKNGNAQRLIRPEKQDLFR